MNQPADMNFFGKNVLIFTNPVEGTVTASYVGRQDSVFFSLKGTAQQTFNDVVDFVVGNTRHHDTAVSIFGVTDENSNASYLGTATRGQLTPPRPAA